MSLKPSARLLISVGSLLFLAIVLGAAHALKLAVPVLLESLLIATAVSLLLLVSIDAWRVQQQPSPQLQRQLASGLSLQHSYAVTLSFTHDYHTALTLEYFDHLPDSFEFSALPYSVTLKPNCISHTGYKIKPLRRGAFHIPGCSIRLPSPMRFWSSQRFLAQPSTLRVYPDFTRIQSGQLQATEHWLKQLGIQQQQRRGSGMEFHQLREFREGDNFKHIDWKATARQRIPIAREYQDERDQQIIFLLDCGRHMRSQDSALSHLDHALNACLLLAHTALRQGDAVGVQTFAGTQRMLKPGKGRAQMTALLNTLYDIHPSQSSADYSAAVERLLHRQKRRALVIVISNIADEADSDLIVAMQRLKKQHRTLLVSLREEALDDLREQPARSLQQALLYCAGIDYLNTRLHHQQKLSSQGVHLLDVRPSQLNAQLVSQYLAMKKAGQY
ncbi:MAG: DUF58 domain-containing protein [Pseudomonas sp.]|nr:DUF58 domain-containing protein [Pseudomonas sp.]